MQVSSGQHPWRLVYRAHANTLRWVVSAGGGCAALIAWWLGHNGIALAIGFNVLIEGVATYQTYTARAAGLPWVYAALTAGRTMIVVAGVLVIVLLGPNETQVRLEWMLMSRAFCSALIVVPCHLFAVRRIPHGKDGESHSLVVDAIRFGAPMAISGVLLFAQEGIVRGALASLISAEAVERYYVHSKCVSIAGTFIVGPVGLWWGAQRFRLAAKGADLLELGARVALKRSLLIYAFLLGSMAMALPELLAVFGPRVKPDLVLIALLAIPPASQLIATLTNAGLMQAGRTHSLAWIQFGGLLFLAVGIIPAAKYFGLSGVCAVAAVGSVSVACLTASASQKRLPLNYQLGRSVSIAATVMILTLVAASYLR